MTTYLLPYTAGTVTTNGTTTVTGALTAWLANVKPGDRFRIGTSSGIVASVESNTSLTLEEAWSGSASGQSYAIDRWSRGWFSGGDLALALALYNTNRPTFIPTTGQPSDAVGADGNVAFDASANIFYVKSGGSWDGGTDIVGPAGADGADGEITRSGAQTGGLAKWASDTAISQATEITLSDGNVGIGTASATQRLHLVASNASTDGIVISNVGGGATRFWINNTTEGLDSQVLLRSTSGGSPRYWSMAIDGSDSHKFKIDNNSTAGGATRVTIDSSGNVGIGTTSPSTTLHVNGPVRTGSYTVATLPSAGTVGAGTRAYVTDASATTFASTVAGGGANAVPVYSDGTNWKIG